MNIHLVYIATHSHHADLIKLAINNNKPVLCEKSFTTNLKEAKNIALAERKCFLGEAIWTRYLLSFYDRPNIRERVLVILVY